MASPRSLIVQRCWFGLALASILLLSASRIWLIAVHVSADPNEGWNAFQAAHALGAAPLYPDPHALTGNNYPPLSFYLAGWAGRVIGDAIVAGRVVALVSTLVVAAGIFGVIRRFGDGGGPAPAIGALLFLAFNATLFRDYLALDDPQWLAHALMTAAIATLLPARADVTPGDGRVICAALLMVLGGLVKHNLLAFPLAATLWLAWHHRRAALVWIATAAAALLFAAAVCYRAYGVDAFVDLLSADRHYSWLRMAYRAAPVVAAMLPLMLVSARLIARRRRDARLDLLLIAVAVAVPLGIIQRSGQGVDRNAHFEALIALCMATGVSLSVIGFGGARAVMRPLPWLVVPLLVLLPGTLRAETGEIRDYPSDMASWRQMEERIAATPGLVACEMPALCYWANKDFAIDFFLYGQRVARRGDAAALEQALARHRFAAIELDAPEEKQRIGEVANPVPALIAARYRVAFVDDDGRRLLVPAP
jgi:hypothetical protein